MRKQWIAFAFMLAVVAFAALGVRYFGMVFTTSTRWAFLALLIATLIPGGNIFSGLKNGYGIILAGYFIWCLMTVAWSEVPTLSLLKSTALILTALAFLSGGIYWSTRLQAEKTFAFLAPITALALIAAVAGSGAQAVNANLSVYTGLASNANFFGVLIAFSVPFLIDQIYQVTRSPGYPVRKILVGGACVILVFALWRSGSRASMLCVLLTVFVPVATVSPNKKIIVALALFLGTLGATVVLPQIQEDLPSMYCSKPMRKERYSIRATRLGKIPMPRLCRAVITGSDTASAPETPTLLSA